MTYFPIQPTLTVGGLVFTDLENLIILTGFLTTTGNYTTLRRIDVAGGVSAGYTPSGANNFRIWAIYGEVQDTTSNRIRVYQTDNDAGINGGTATNPVYFTGDSSFYQLGFPLNANSSQIAGRGYGPAGPVIQNTRYCTFFAGIAASAFCTVYGYEEA